MFTGKRFSSSSAPLDKRGKPKKLDEGNSLRQYYRMEDDDDGDKVKSEEEDEDKAKLKEEGEEEDSEEVEELGVEESEDGVASGGSDTTTDTDTKMRRWFFSDGAPGIESEDIPEIEKETHGLAIVNLDWRHVKAVDLCAVLRSFLPRGGQMKSVTVYPSEFGLQRMKDEELCGPVGLFDDENEKSDEDDNIDDDDEDLLLRKCVLMRKAG